MTPKEIIAADAAKNHPDIPLEDHVERVGRLLAAGGQIVQQGNTLFLYKPKDDRQVEFHTYNADPAEKLVENTRKFFRLLKRVGAQEVFTMYANPRISELFKMLEPEFKARITKGDQYVAKVRLA